MPFGLQLLEPPIEEPLLHLELGDAVPQQAADPIVALEHRDPMAGAVELLGGRQTRRARSDHRHALAASAAAAAAAPPTPRRTPAR